MMLSNEVLEVADVGMQTCLNATLHVVEGARRTLETRLASAGQWRSSRSAAPPVAFKHVCMPTAATSSTSFDSIIHPMDQGKSTFYYMSIGWLFRKILRKNRGIWRVRHPINEHPPKT